MPARLYCGGVGQNLQIGRGGVENCTHRNFRIECDEASSVFLSECKQVNVGELARTVNVFGVENRFLAQGYRVGPKLMVGLVCELPKHGDNASRRHSFLGSIGRCRHYSNYPVLRKRTTCPSAFRILIPPGMSACVENVVFIEESDEEISIKEAAHCLDALLIHYSLNLFHRDDFPCGWQHWYAVFNFERAFTTRRRGECAARELRDNLASGGIIPLSDLLSCLQDILVNVECGSHASDAVAS